MIFNRQSSIVNRQSVIEGVVLKKLAVHKDERGMLFEVLRSDWDIFNSFGQAYITVCKKGWVKGWHYHKKQRDRFCVIGGKAKIVLYDGRKNSKTKGKINEFVLSKNKPFLLLIPSGVVHGFEAIGKDAWILNIPDKLFNYKKPDEHRIPLQSKDIPYKSWRRRKGG